MSTDVRPHYAPQTDATGPTDRVGVAFGPVWSEAQLLVLQHPELARVRFSCTCASCHRQILAVRFCPELADAWMSARGELVHPADVPLI